MSHLEAHRPEPPATASSSQTSPSNHNAPRQTEDDIDDVDDLLADDYLNGHSTLNDPVSFKRASKATKPSFASRFLSSPFSSSRNVTPSTGSSDNESSEPRRRGIGVTTNTILSYLNTSALDTSTFGLQDAKDAAGLDWYVEGPGRRVGYDNLTAIDWIYEYAKERTRLQHLAANSTGLVGQIKLAADASQVWWILVAAGITVGAIAAGIDVASDWLGDLKTGICSNVEEGGRFYLNKVFCCWGAASLDSCADWRSWGQFMGISNRGGIYVIGYLFFVLFSVSS